MNDSSSGPVLAIDGGGTRCRIALCDGQDITTVETGPANVSTDFAGGVQQILAGLEMLATQTGRKLDDLVGYPAFVGLAGVSGPKIADRLKAALPLRHARIEDDRPAAVRGALGEKDGAIAHCGTGSFYGAQKAGAMRFSGGWGSVLGDEASAQWVGRTALRLTLETVDGRFQSTPLAQKLLDRFDGAEGIVRFAGNARPSEFGALAPMVTESANENDVLGRQVMSAGAADIARSLPLIGWVPGSAICLTGGIGPHFGPFLLEPMQADLTKPRGEPLSGAVSLARELIQETKE